jgi:single-strand DNA-binding protein
MANQIQRVEYEGYLAANPEMKYTPAGKNVTNFRMASNSQYKNANGEVVKETIWLKIVTWGKLAEIVNQYCAQGSWVVVAGKLLIGEGGNPTVFQRKDGSWGASFEITANEVRILKGKDGAAVSGEDAHASSGDEDIPF